MMPYFSETFGNASSSTHHFGSEAEAAVKVARETIADEINAKPKEILFTSGATEALNLAIKGVAHANKPRGKHLVTIATEHHAVLDSFAYLRSEGYETSVLPVPQTGRIDPLTVGAALRDDTILVAIMAANNEIGTIQPIDEIGAFCRDRNVFFLTDATQALGKWKIDVQSGQIDLLAASSHKIYGPKGVGFLYSRSLTPKVLLTPLLHGGGQERALRSGTLNIPGIVGFAKAVEIARKHMEEESRWLAELRDRLKHGLSSEIVDVTINGDMEHRLPNNLNVSFLGVDSQALMLRLRDEIAMSSGSACTSNGTEPSHVLTALGCSKEVAHSAIRFGIGRYTSTREIDTVIERVAAEVDSLRALSGE
jgi:cysteine desulfurase